MQKVNLNIKSIRDLSLFEKEQIAIFLSQNSILDKEYVYTEFLAHQDRDVLLVTAEDQSLKLVLSMKHIITGKVNLVYWGDMIKEKSFKGLNITFLFFRYLKEKEGRLGVFLKNKDFVSFCYNPRVYEILPDYLKNYSVLDENIDDRYFRDCLQRLGYESQIVDGYFHDKAIKESVVLANPERYFSRCSRTNDFFHKNVLKKTDDQQLLFTGKSMAVVSSYTKKRLLAGLGVYLRSAMSHFTKSLSSGKQGRHLDETPLSSPKVSGS